MTDQKLVEDFLKNRSENAFSRLYRERTPRLYQIALRLVAHNEEEARELIQETWVTAVRKLPEFQWRSELNTWLTGILINVSRQSRRQQEKETLLADTDSETPMTRLDIVSAMDLENAIDQLPPGYRQIIILHDIEGYKHREIAEILDIEEGTSKSQLYHARRAMRQLLIDTIKK